jgi:hypothetical protein
MENELRWMVYRYSPRRGPIEAALDHSFSAHGCTRGREIGIRESYETRVAAETDAKRLQAHVNDDACRYASVLIAA